MPGLAALLGEQQDVAASFQRVAVETLVDKTIKAFEDYSPVSVVIAGGVAASSELRKTSPSAYCHQHASGLSAPTMLP